MCLDTTPKIKFTKAKLLNESPCADGLLFAKSCGFDFVKIYNTCERGDWMIWLLRRTGKINKFQSVKIAIECAEHVLPIFEKKYPDDKRPRNSIQASRAWLNNPTEANRSADAYAADAAAYAAAAAAYAAAAYAAAYAAAAASDADAASDAARANMRAHCCEIVRKHLPTLP